MKRRILKLTLVCLALTSISSEAKPNIIYINVDDLGWADLGYQGSTYYETPHIDKLAKSGAIFTNAYAPAANCAPSRACCMTGQWTPRHGVYTVNNSDRGNPKDRKLIPVKNTLHIKDSNLTMATALKNAGYKTCHIGKWHLSKDPTNNGFDINIAGTHAGGPYSGGYHSPYKYPNCEQKEPGEYLTDRLTSEAIGFIDKHQHKPFFLHLAYFTVHTPIQGKKDKIKKFKVKTPSNGQNNATYAAMISSLDDNIGKLKNYLEQKKLLENTLILFTSDNGGVWKISKQWPLRAGKGSYYEGGIREPLIISWKGKIKPDTRVHIPVQGIDYFPTFLAAAGAKKPDTKKLDGINILPLAMGKDEPSERALYWHFPIYLQGGNEDCQDSIFRTRPGSAIRHGNWKLIEYFENGELELYHLKKDPSEKSNVAKTFPSKTKALLEMLSHWRDETGAPVPTEKNPGFIAK